MFLGIVILSLAAVGYSNPLTWRSDEAAPAGATFVRCHEGTTDPLCHLVRQPDLTVVTEITHPNGTTETKRGLYTREHLRKIREQNKAISVEHKPGQTLPDEHAKFIHELTKRESAPQICTTEECTEAIATSFAIAQTWTYGLEANFNDIITLNFGFSWGSTYTLTDTRTCQWNFVESGSHSIWYQPLMSYHHGYANYQTHVHCYAGISDPASDGYYDHHYGYANVNQAGNNGINLGNLGCNSGCGGSDHRQCQNGNNGGELWPYAN